MQQAIAVYSSDELDTDPGNGGENNVHLKDWLSEGRKKLDEAREALRYLCEPVPPPREVEQYLHYFCGDAANPNALNETEAVRISFYKTVAVYVRAFAAIAQDLTDAGYSDAEAASIEKDVEFYSEIRSAIKKHSGEELDIKPYEAGVRHFDSSFGGVGGHPAKVKYGGGYTGNVCTEDLVNLFESMGIDTGIDLDGLLATAEWCEQALGRELHGRVTRSGLNTLI